MEDTPSIPNNILETQLSFPHFVTIDKWNYFLESKLGQIYQCIPWEDLVESIGSKMPSKGIGGNTPRLDLHGKIALMFLKSYLDISDLDLIERLNTDYSLQYFCHCIISAHDPIKNADLPSEVRVELSKYIDYDHFQKILAIAWTSDMDHTKISLQDATCYETSMRYPTDVKILYEVLLYLHKYMLMLCKANKLRMPRNKFKKQKSKTLAYLKTRRKTYKKTRKRVKSLLYIVEKQIKQMDELLDQYSLNAGQFEKRYPIIKKILDQRKQWYEGTKPQDLILSMDKPYIRPIVRGKENKRVEFGAKVNMLQVDGINFIEHLSFDAFHEGNRLQKGIQLHRKLFGICTMVAADAIYATNANRSYCSKNKILTNFKPKGRAGKGEDQMKVLRKELNKERSTTLEGSFGVEKEIYGLKNIRARTQKTEILMIYFAIHLRNANIIAQKRFTNRNKVNSQNIAA